MPPKQIIYSVLSAGLAVKSCKTVLSGFPVRQVALSHSGKEEDSEN
jgi:hypothetical protein